MDSSSNAAKHLPPPQVLWAQRRDKILLTVVLENCVNPIIKLKENSLYFKGKGGSNLTEHEVLMEFNKTVDPNTSQQRVTGREITFVVAKAEDSYGFWPRLLSDSKKVHYLKTDFDKWKDEDDTDGEEGGNNENFNLDEMMASMGGMQGAGGDMGEEQEEDSDDEELPDLQN